MDPAEIAEDAMAYLPGARLEREWVLGGCLSWLPGPTPFFANVSAVRADGAETLRRLANHAVEWFGARGRQDCYWFLSPSTTPIDAVEVLTELGVSIVGHGTALMMSSPPPPGPDGIEIREVDGPDSFLTYRLLTLEAGATGGVDDAARAAAIASHDEAWQDMRALGRRRRSYLAYVDGEPLSAGGLLLTEHGVACLAGGATAPSARGRGLYRALVRHRWDIAAAEGVPTLVVQASDDSEPILSALGFTKVADLTLMRQSFSAPRR
jgi:GNAT superfamily N-acetyltransferase